MLGEDGRVRIAGEAANGEEMLANLERWRPDVIILDLNMPGLGGLTTLDRILQARPTPVIVLSTHSGEGAPQALEALSRGAVDFVDKEAYSLIDFQRLRPVLITKILEVAGHAPGRPHPPNSEEASGGGHSAPTRLFAEGIGLVVIGASTGGTIAIEAILGSLGGPIPAPIAIVQHMPAGFTRAFAERLNRSMDHVTVREASDGHPLTAGSVTIATGGLHMKIRAGTPPAGVLDTLPSDVPHRPSVDVLFESAAGTLGNRVLGVLLTGMGRDGARGMVALRAAGAHTIAQDEHSSIIYGMPRAARAMGAVEESLPLEKIGPRVGDMARAAHART
jgi:two-component system chemotaxis response regulator CheB